VLLLKYQMDYIGVHCLRGNKKSVMPDFKLKPNVQCMCAQESSFHIYHTENGYIIMNVIIYNIFIT
jgi:hypothetical protein